MKCFSCFFNIEHSFLDYTCDKSIFVDLFPNLKLYDCPQCGIVSIDHAAIDTQILNQYYLRTYRTEDGKDENSKEIDFNYRNAYFKARADGQYEAISHHINDIPINNILEFGAGYGFSLKTMGEKFPNANLFTYDIDDRSRLFNQNVSTDDGSVKYDIIIMSHVIEHLVYPQKTVNELSNKLHPKGILLIDAPNEERMAKYRIKPQILTPHLTFFSPKSIKGFCESNFKDLEIVDLFTSGSVWIDPDIIDNRKKISLKKSIKEFLRENLYPLFVTLRYVYNINKPKDAAGNVYDFSSFVVNHVEDTHNDIRVVLRKKTS